MTPMMMLVQQMNQQMQDLQRQLASDEKGSSEDVIERKTQEFLEAKIEQLIDADSDGEQDEVLAMLQRISNQLESGPSPAAPGGEGNWQTQLIGLVQGGHVTPSDAKEMLDKLKGSDEPVEVLDKKYEKEIREMELDKQSETVERVGEIGEKLVETFGKSVAESLTEAPADGATATEAGESAEAGEVDAGEPAAPETTEPTVDATEQPASVLTDGGPPCPYCETAMHTQGDHEYCPNCEHMVAPCDGCGHPLDVPPKDAADLRACPECVTVDMLEIPDGAAIPLPDDDGEAVACGHCGWDGIALELGRELLTCDGCGEVRPILRADEMAAAPVEAD